MRFKKVLFLLLSIFAIADSAESSSREKIKKTSWEQTLNIELQLKSTIFSQTNGEDTDNNLISYEIAPHFESKYKSDWRLYFAPMFIASPENRSEAEKYYFDPNQLFAEFKKNALVIQAGYNIFSWGVTDGYNPVDVINSRQLFNPFKSQKRGAASILISESLDSIDYDIVYIPLATGGLLPQDHSRWLPQEIFIPQNATNNLTLLLPKNLRYSFGARTSLNNCSENNLALRVQKNMSFIDASLSAYEGISSSPLIEPQISGTITQIAPKTVIQVDPDILLIQKDYRIREVGFTLVAQIWNSLFKYETSYSQSLGNEINLPGWTHENVLALEKTFSTSEGTLIGILQYSFINSEKQTNSNVAISEIFRNTFMLGGHYIWKENWTISGMTLYNQLYSSQMEQASIGRQFNDAWNFAVGTNFFHGQSQTPLGVYNKNQSWSFDLSYIF